MKEIPKELFAELVYDPDMPGCLRWVEVRGNRRQAVGHLTNHGYYRFSYKGSRYLSHRVVWALHGNDQATDVDHINRDRTDNRIENLRAASTAENAFNQVKSVRPASGVRGVYWGAGVWYSCIRANGVTHRFSSKDRQAVEDWAKAKREELHGQYANHT